MGREWNPLIAAALSFFIPGAGSIYKGQWQRGAFWFLLVIITSPFGLGLIFWLINIYDAYKNNPYGHFSAESEGYGELTSESSETTRFLCASAITLGWQFRRKILSQLDKKYQATAPEFGLDAELLVHVCKSLENRENKYLLGFVGLGIFSIFLTIATVIITIFNKNLALIIILIQFLFIFATALLYFYKTYDENYNLAPYFTKEKFDRVKVLEKFGVSLNSDILERIPNKEQNLVVYKGFSPFIGSGIDLGGWSFAIDISRPQDEKTEPLPFEISAIYLELQNSIKALELRGLTIKDIVFVNGADIRNDRMILPHIFGHPVQHIEPEAMKAYSNNDDFRIRHYKRIAVQDWGNDMIYSLFLRCSMRGKNLFMEISQFLLTPLDGPYRQIDSLNKKSWRSLLILAVTSLVLGPFFAIWAWFGLLGSIYNNLGLPDREEEKKIKDNLLYNYGVPTSIRHMTSSLKYLHYFQKLDREMYIKVINRNILDTVTDFLDDHKIDTYTLKEQRLAIVNNGVLVQGGNIEAQSLAAGINAQAVTNPATKLEKEKT